jgi:hypothetical protein
MVAGGCSFPLDFLDLNTGVSWSSSDSVRVDVEALGAVSTAVLGLEGGTEEGRLAADLVVGTAVGGWAFLAEGRIEDDSLRVAEDATLEEEPWLGLLGGASEDDLVRATEVGRDRLEGTSTTGRVTLLRSVDGS